MAVIVSVFAIVLISMLINRIATIALALTGVSREEARFQARAAMSGVGLTTRSPDEIVAHPVRRRIVLYLMILGSAGIITGIASLVLSFNGGTAGQRLIRAAVLVGALFGLFLLSRTKSVDRPLPKRSAGCCAGGDSRPATTPRCSSWAATTRSPSCRCRRATAWPAAACASCACATRAWS
jgi:hypothetical protein